MRRSHGTGSQGPGTHELRCDRRCLNRGGPGPTASGDAWSTKKKPNLFSRDRVGEGVRWKVSLDSGFAYFVRPGSTPLGIRNGITLMGIWRAAATTAEVRDAVPSTLAGGPIADPAAPTRIHIGGGEHAQERRAAPRPIRPDATAYPGDRPCPFETLMQRCGLLGLRFVHRTRLPRVETRPKQQVHAPHSIGPRGTRIPRGGGHPGKGDGTSGRVTTRRR